MLATKNENSRKRALYDALQLALVSIKKDSKNNKQREQERGKQ